MKKTQLLEIITEKEKKYFDLVWYARKNEADRKDKKISKIIEKMEKKYPDEIEELLFGENSEWDHGFNSGMLAGLRYVMSLDEHGAEHADEEFPMLDT